MTITEKQLNELGSVKLESFTGIRRFSDHNLASALIMIDISNVKGKMKDFLIDFFHSQTSNKHRIKTLMIWRRGNDCFIQYRALHGFGYAWSQDLENEFSNYLIKRFNISRKSKSFLNIIFKCKFNF